MSVRGVAFSCRGVGHSSVRERLKIHDCQVGKNQIICLRFANLRKVGRRHPTFLSPSASSGRHRLPGQKIGAAAPLFPVREGSRTATIAVLTDQGRSSSCKVALRVARCEKCPYKCGKTALVQPLLSCFRTALGAYPKGGSRPIIRYLKIGTRPPFSNRRKGGFSL